jgi:O-antigen ligase
MAGIGFDPNDIAFIVVSLLPFSVCVALGSFRKVAKALALASIVFGALLALYTASRGGLLGIVTFLVLFLVVRVRGVPRTGKVLMVVVIAFAALMNADKINMDRYLTLGELESDYNVTTEFGRLGIWRRGLRLFAEDPLTGVGVNAFGEAIGMARIADNVQPQWQAPHNSYIQVIAETGAVGGLAFLLLIGTCVTALVRISRKAGTTGNDEVARLAAILLIGLIAQLMSAFFLSQAYSMFLTLSFAAATALKGIGTAPAPTRSPAPPGSGRTLGALRPTRTNLDGRT